MAVTEDFPDSYHQIQKESHEQIICQLLVAPKGSKLGNSLGSDWVRYAKFCVCECVCVRVYEPGVCDTCTYAGRCTHKTANQGYFVLFRFCIRLNTLMQPTDPHLSLVLKHFSSDLFSKPRLVSEDQKTE